jgi:polyhydroxyalkanoate synthesis regulator phasin
MFKGHGVGQNTAIHNRYTADVVAEIRDRVLRGRMNTSDAKQQMDDIVKTFRDKIDRREYWADVPD